EESKPLASIITRGLGFGVQVARKVKRAVKKVAEALTTPFKVFTQNQSIQPESTTDNATQPNSSADSTSVSTSVISFG
ncbi:RNA polymerase subunit sigma, partial [Acaryochloris marina NIES-2412]